jgi:hypothetical protein
MRKRVAGSAALINVHINVQNSIAACKLLSVRPIYGVAVQILSSKDELGSMELVNIIFTFFLCF